MSPRSGAWTAVAFGLFLSGGSVPALDLRIGQEAPAFALPDLPGKEHALKDLRGKPAAVLFGELYNRNTLSALRELDAKLKSQPFAEAGARAVLILGSSDPPEKLAKDLAEAKLPGDLLVLWDRRRKAFEDYGVKVLPTAVIVDAEGKVSLGLSGFPLNFADVVGDGILFAQGKIDRGRLETVLHPANQGAPDEKQLKALRTARMAAALSKRKLYDLSVERFREALALDPSLLEARIGLAGTLLDLGQVAEAEEIYAQALARSPDLDEAHIGLARIEIKRDQTDAALKRLKERLALHPLNPELHFLVGAASEKRGEKDEALAAYKRAAQILLERSGERLGEGERRTP